jgi:hypothetical protein
MFEPELFDTQYAVVGKTLAEYLSADNVSEQMVQSFFSAIDGRENMDWHCVNRGVVIEWHDTWNIENLIPNHTTFRLMPIEAVPPNLFSERQARFNNMPQVSIKQGNAKHTDHKWFDVYTQRREGENDVMFESRMIKTIIATFRALKKQNAQP